jgi:tRNA A-37 threonylcarbamoyl transferase component Bud32
MTPSSPSKLGEVLAEYLQAMERGEAPDRKALLAKHSELAAELSAYFIDLDRMDRLAGPLKLSDPAVTSGLDVDANLPTIRYFGDYELESEIARGGMGIVFRARQKSLNRVVALKMILSGQLASDADRLRFRQEADAAASLDHPNILPIYEVGEHDGRPYFSMKLIDGGNLRAPSSESPRTAVRGLVGVLAKVAQAVHFAHQRGILHRDLKPANILLDSDGTPYVTDFGLAKRVGGDSGLTHTGAVLGSPSYMAPEQARGDKGISTAADVYSLGAILYELLAGRPPFRGETVYETIKEVIEREPVPPRALNPKADRDLSAIALKCLAKAPAGRYGSAEELANDLDRWLAGEATKARPPSLAGLAIRWLRRNAMAATTVVVIGVVWGVLTSLILFVADGRARASSRPVRLLAEGESWFNPTGWAFRTGWQPLTRWGIIAGAAFLWLSIGWCLRAGARPRTPAGAFGAAAAAALVAAWVCNLFVAPMFAGSVQTQLYPLRAQEPPTWRPHPDWNHILISLPDIDIPHPDLQYMEQFVPPEKRDPTRIENASAYGDAHRDLMEANRYYRATAGVWMAQFATLFFFLTASLSSAWATHYLMRSDRGPVARITCYAELYLSVLAMLIAGTIFAAFLQIALGQDPASRNGPPIWPFAVMLAGAVAIALTAFFGIIRRWHWWIRPPIYLASIAVVIWAQWAWMK